MTRALSEAQLRALIRAVRDKVPGAGVIGVHTTTPWTGADSLRVGEEDVEVAYCASTLAVRERLVRHSAAARPLALLTDRTEPELGLDILTRLVKRRLFQVESWRVARDAFKAREVDPRLARESWIADLLVELAPAEGYPPVPSGVLDADTVWQIVLCDHLGFGDAQPDARDLLLWTTAPKSLARFEASPAEMRGSVAERLAVTAGSVGAAIMHAVQAGRGQDALALGLTCRALFSAARDSEPRLREASVRLEPVLGGQALGVEDGLRWAAAAEAVLPAFAETRGPKAASTCLERADTLLRELRAEEFAHLSDVLLSGFEQRLARYAAALGESLRNAPESSTATLEASASAVLDHEQARERSDRAEAVRMSLRLARWLRQPPVVPGSFADAACAYASDGAWVDRARAILDDGDPHGPASNTYQQLTARVIERREQMNCRFAELLAESTALGSTDERVLPVEMVLTRVVAPLAREAPVLLVVADGMSFAVFHELMSDLTRLGWVELGEADSPARRPAIAALPSITAVSRASLLCGTLRTGPAAAEREGFASCPDLVAVSRSAFPPVLFHKADLTEVGGGGLATDVRAEIERKTRQVVGLVINAVDDHLARGDQLRVRWSTDSIRPLGWVLDAAREAGRVVVLTSDHGHVVERDLTHRPHETGGLRHRDDDGVPATDEIALRGPRVLWPGARVIAPWSERVRYGGRQNGYHGGVTPQEVVIPLAVLRADDEPLPGWIELPPAVPAWWAPEMKPVPPVPRERARSPVAREAVAPPPPVAGRHQGELFPAPQAPESRVVAESWIDRLLASPTFAAQKTLAGRVGLPDDRIRACLVALDERGGKLTRGALAHVLGVPLLRVGGFIAALRRVLNVDGYPVLTLDETADTVELNVPLLTVQFEL